mmetsp:Transcript_1475/g.2094  ORF Transcript_1475/g.2094 Transcript_1475/m.2094 type:complete len:410 (-) Transcript_1475:115-1344(-)
MAFRWAPLLVFSLLPTYRRMNTASAESFSSYRPSFDEQIDLWHAQQAQTHTPPPSRSGWSPGMRFRGNDREHVEYDPPGLTPQEVSEIINSVKREDEIRLQEIEEQARKRAWIVGISVGGAMAASNFLSFVKNRYKAKEARRMEIKRQSGYSNFSEAFRAIPAFKNFSRYVDSFVPGADKGDGMRRMLDMVLSKETTRELTERGLMSPKVIRGVLIPVLATIASGRGLQALLGECPRMHLLRSPYVRSSSFDPMQLSGRWYLSAFSGLMKPIHHCQAVDRIVTPSMAINERVQGQFGFIPFVFHRRLHPKYGQGIYKRSADYPVAGLLRMTTVIVEVLRSYWTGYTHLVEFSCANFLGVRFEEVRVLSRSESTDISIIDYIRETLHERGISHSPVVLDRTGCPIEKPRY